MSQYADSKFFCPLCSTSVMTRKEKETTLIYCPSCQEEMLVLREPRIETDEDKKHVQH